MLGMDPQETADRSAEMIGNAAIPSIQFPPETGPALRLLEQYSYVRREDVAEHIIKIVSGELV